MKHRGPVLRALLTALDGWVTNGEEPPASRYPRIDDGTLVGLPEFQKQFPKTPGTSLAADYYRPLRLERGPRWESERIATIVPPKVGSAYQTLIPAVDRDGNELAGIRLPDIAVPIATYMGWNLRAEQYGAGGVLSDLDGSCLEFPKTVDDRRKSGDPRPSVRERYPSRRAISRNTRRRSSSCRRIACSWRKTALPCSNTQPSAISGRNSSLEFGLQAAFDMLKRSS